MTASIMRRETATGELFDDLPLSERFVLAKNAARELTIRAAAVEPLDAARGFGTAMMRSFWGRRTSIIRCRWPIAPPPMAWPEPTDTTAALARELGELAARFDDVRAGFELGSIYTALMPVTLRSQWGAYYTPAPYAELLLDRVEGAGFDWTRGSITDPACGGGAFLTPVALRMSKRAARRNPNAALLDICGRLRGYELDPFAAWVSHVCLEAALLPLCVRADRRLPCVVETGDSLTMDDRARFDVVIGNPPYGRVRLDEAARQRFARSLYGHANLYGLFADLSIRLAKPGGIVALVTPTSFLGGQYFKSLRALLSSAAPLRSIDFVDERTGVFDDVLQETSLAVFVKGSTSTAAEVRAAGRDAHSTLRSQRLGCYIIGPGTGPWLLPRRAAQRQLIGRAASMRGRLGDHGFTVSTGPLVWNRHKQQLRSQRGDGEHPLIWAESVSANGFRFDPRRKHHAPYFEVRHGQDHLLTHKACMLVQRTTAKEQRRRLVAAVMPEAFVRRFSGVVIENHLNFICSQRPDGIDLHTLCTLLNSEAVDHAFRCISGSVAVSAYELNDLPLPDLAQLESIQAMLRDGAPPEAIERRVNAFYGL